MAKANQETPEQKIERLEAELSQANEVIAEQSEALKSVKVEKEAKAPVIKVGKKTYKITIQKFLFEGEEKTAEDLKKDADLFSKLLEIGFGGIEEIN
jgi:hypothetical protein